MKVIDEHTAKLPNGYTVESRTYGPSHKIGSLDRRNLSFDIRTPFSMQVWRDGEFRFSWRRLFNPLRWWRALRKRANWRFQWRRWKDANHRCCCPVGTTCDGTIALCGFGVQWWYSRYGGPVPCTCDEVISEMEGA